MDLTGEGIEIVETILKERIEPRNRAIFEPEVTRLIDSLEAKGWKQENYEIWVQYPIEGNPPKRSIKFEVRYFDWIKKTKSEEF